MPTVAQIGPYRFFFYSNEGDESPHIHVKRESKIAKLWLDPVGLGSSGGFPPARVAGNRANRYGAWSGLDRGMA
jgi:hypothetical protein